MGASRSRYRLLAGPAGMRRHRPLQAAARGPPVRFGNTDWKAGVAAQALPALSSPDVASLNLAKNVVGFGLWRSPFLSALRRGPFCMAADDSFRPRWRYHITPQPAIASAPKFDRSSTASSPPVFVSLPRSAAATRSGNETSLRHSVRKYGSGS